jgi:hypothetical protein
VTVVALIACVAIVGVVASSGSSDGRQMFVFHDDDSALLVDWARVGDDVSGSMTYAHLVRHTLGVLEVNRHPEETPRDVQRASGAFTGSVGHDGVRLQFDDGPFGNRLNGRLDGDALLLVIGQDRTQQTISITRASRTAFDAAVTKLRAAADRHAASVRSRRLRQEATARRAIARVATAYQKALEPDSLDDPCRYLTIAARAQLLADASPAQRTEGCSAVVRLREREQQRTPYPKHLGAPQIDLAEFVDVPSQTTGALAEGAELRFTAIPDRPIGLVEEGGTWRIAKYK